MQGPVFQEHSRMALFGDLPAGRSLLFQDGGAVNGKIGMEAWKMMDSRFPVVSSFGCYIIGSR